MDAHYRPIRCYSNANGFPTMVVENRYKHSRCEDEPGKILGFPIIGYDIDNERLLVHTCRDRKGNYLGDAMTATIIYSPDTEEYAKMHEYVDNLFGIVSAEEYYKENKNSNVKYTDFTEEEKAVLSKNERNCSNCGCTNDVAFQVALDSVSSKPDYLKKNHAFVCKYCSNLTYLYPELRS